MHYANVVIVGISQYSEELKKQIAGLVSSNCRTNIIGDLGELCNPKEYNKYNTLLFYSIDFDDISILKKSIKKSLKLLGKAVHIAFTSDEAKVRANNFPVGIDFVVDISKLNRERLKSTIQLAYQRRLLKSQKPLFIGKESLIFDQSLTPTLILTSAGTIIGANKSILSILEYEKWELMGGSLQNIVYIDPENVIERWKQILVGDRPKQGRGILKKSDGRKVFVYYQIVQYLKDSFIISFKDITLELIEVRKKELISEIYQVMASENESNNQKINKILQRVISKLQYDYGELWWSNAGADFINLESYHGKSSGLFNKLSSISPEIEIEVSKNGLPARCFNDQQNLFYNDIKNVSEFTRRNLLNTEDKYSCFAMPLSLVNIKKGVLLLFKKEDDNYNQNTEAIVQEVLTEVGSTITSVIEKCKVNDEVERLTAHSNELIAVVGFSSRFYKINKAFEELLELPKEELLKATAFDFVAETDYAKAESMFNRVLAGESISGENLNIISSTGRKRIVEFSVIPEPVSKCLYIIGRDITTKTIVRQKLSIANQKFSLTMEAAKLGVWEWDVKNQTIDFDKGLQNIYGLKKGEQITSIKHWQSFLHPHEKDFVIESFQNAATSENKLEIEHQVIQPNGLVKHVRTSAISNRNSEGQVVSLTGLTIDISDYVENEKVKQRALEELETKENRFRNLIEHNNDAIIIQADNLDVLYASPSIEGYTPEEVLSTNGLSYIHPEDVQRLSPIMDAFWKGEEGNMIRIKERVLHKKGYYVWIEANISDQRNVIGVEGMVYNIKDISKEEEDRIKLEASEKHLANAQELAKIGYYIVDLINGESVWSPYLYKLLGLPETIKPYEPQEFVDKMVFPADKHIFPENTFEDFDVTKEFEHRIQRPGGEILWVKNIVTKVFNDKNEVIRIEGTLQDITEKNNFIEAIQNQNEKFRNIAQMQSHQVRAPLARLIGLIDVFKSGAIDEKEKEFAIENILSSAEELDTLIKRIINRSQPTKIPDK